MIEFEGPYTSKAVDGLKTPAYVFLPGGERKDIGEVTVKVDGGMTFDVQLDDDRKDIETAAFDVPMRFAYLNLPEKSKINWGYNCLTVGVHHGRPEALWNLPLLQTTHMFTPEQLQELVVDRIYNDAMQFVEHSRLTRSDTEEPLQLTQAWADQIMEYVKPTVLPVYRKKLDEITEYYQSPRFRRDLDGVIGFNKTGKLNPRYQPLHDHDSINMLCRIVGTGASIEASKDIAE